MSLITVGSTAGVQSYMSRIIYKVFSDRVSHQAGAPLSVGGVLVPLCSVRVLFLERHYDVVVKALERFAAS